MKFIYLGPVPLEPPGAVVGVARLFGTRFGTNQRRTDDVIHLITFNLLIIDVKSILMTVFNH